VKRFRFDVEDLARVEGALERGTVPDVVRREIGAEVGLQLRRSAANSTLSSKSARAVVGTR